MNLFKIYSKKIIDIIYKNKDLFNINSKKLLNDIIVENPPSGFDFDLSTNAAIKISKFAKDNPLNVAYKLKKLLIKNISDFEDIQSAGPGFLNLKLSKKAWLKTILLIIKNKKKFGSNNNNKKYNIEFVSANPTGPLHVGHCRGAIFGDVLSNLLKFNGNKVTKEFYVNDYGNQIDIFSKSVYYRLKEIKLKEKFPDNQDLYPGQYIKNIADKILKSNKKIKLNSYESIKKILKKQALKESMNLIKNDLKNLGIKHDIFFSETDIVNKKLVQKTIAKLKKDKFVEEGFLNPPKGEATSDWKKIKRLIFKSTVFGDDANRALQKNDGSWTYFANDVAYHSNKVSRKYDYLINVLGADHIGYVKRISAAVNALSKNKTILICKVCQLVKLFKNGSPYKMSKRLGDFISVNDLLEEVDRDSIRFMMLNRSNDVELDFDFNKVMEKSKDNPVFYVQYCYARINSLFRILKKDLNSNININEKNFNPNKFEYDLLRKISEWPKIVEASANKHQPHKIPFYLYDLSTIFHAYWTKGNENPSYKFIVDDKINNILSFKIFQLLSIVLENGMSILGVSLPKKM